MRAFCCEMEMSKQYSVAYKGLKNSSFDFVFEVDDTLFAAYESRDIRGGKCSVEVTMFKAEHQLDFDVTITGEVICECDRCLEDCTIPVDYEGHLVVRLSDQQGEYDGDIMWLNPQENEVDLTQYIYESIVLSLPYQRIHPEGECNPDMLAHFSVVDESEIEAIESRATASDPHNIDEGDFNKLAALKALMEQGKE